MRAKKDWAIEKVSKKTKNTFTKTEKEIDARFKKYGMAVSSKIGRQYKVIFLTGPKKDKGYFSVKGIDALKKGIAFLEK